MIQKLNKIRTKWYKIKLVLILFINSIRQKNENIKFPFKPKATSIINPYFD